MYDISFRGWLLAREFPYIRRQVGELRMDFPFVDPGECNLNMVHEFYEN